MNIYEYDEERQRQFDKAEGMLEELKRATIDAGYREELFRIYNV